MIAPFVLGVALLAQTVMVPPQQDPLTENRAPVRVNPPPNASGAPSPRVDRLFATAANDSSNAELVFAQLALQRGHTDEVKSYARKMISEHTGLMHALEPRLRRVMGKSPPRELVGPDALTYYRLQHIADVDFDQTYILTQVTGHLATLARLRRSPTTVPTLRSRTSSANGCRRFSLTSNLPSILRSTSAATVRSRRALNSPRLTSCYGDSSGVIATPTGSPPTVIFCNGAPPEGYWYSSEA